MLYTYTYTYTIILYIISYTIISYTILYYTLLIFLLQSSPIFLFPYNPSSSYHPFLSSSSSHLIYLLLPPMFQSISSIPISFKVYVSVLGYAYLYSILIQEYLTPHVLSEWRVEVCRFEVCGSSLCFEGIRLLVFEFCLGFVLV